MFSILPRPFIQQHRYGATDFQRFSVFGDLRRIDQIVGRLEEGIKRLVNRLGRRIFVSGDKLRDLHERTVAHGK